MRPGILLREKTGDVLLDLPELRGVLDLLDAEVTLVPSGGNMLFQGPAEAEAFWFPENAPPSTVDRFVANVISTDGGDDWSQVIARFEMETTIGGTRYGTAGYQVITARPVGDTWKIKTLLWTHPPWEQID